MHHPAAVPPPLRGTWQEDEPEGCAACADCVTHFSQFGCLAPQSHHGTPPGEVDGVDPVPAPGDAQLPACALTIIVLCWQAAGDAVWAAGEEDVGDALIAKGAVLTVDEGEALIAKGAVLLTADEGEAPPMDPTTAIVQVCVLVLTAAAEEASHPGLLIFPLAVNGTTSHAFRAISSPVVTNAINLVLSHIIKASPKKVRCSWRCLTTRAQKGHADNFFFW
jgi:hypothetical protein